MEREKLFLFETRGFSMWPFLKEGAKLIIKKVPIKDLDTGDIILYRTNNQMVCHRLIKKNKYKKGQLLYVRGDNSISRPEPITDEMFLGKVMGVMKNSKIVSLVTKKQQFINRLIIIIAPLISKGIKIGKILLE